MSSSSFTGSCCLIVGVVVSFASSSSSNSIRFGDSTVFGLTALTCFFSRMLANALKLGEFVIAIPVFSPRPWSWSCIATDAIESDITSDLRMVFAWSLSDCEL